MATIGLHIPACDLKVDDRVSVADRVGLVLVLRVWTGPSGRIEAACEGPSGGGYALSADPDELLRIERDYEFAHPFEAHSRYPLECRECRAGADRPWHT